MDVINNVVVVVVQLCTSVQGALSIVRYLCFIVRLPCCSRKSGELYETVEVLGNVVFFLFGVVSLATSSGSCSLPEMLGNSVFYGEQGCSCPRRSSWGLILTESGVLHVSLCWVWVSGFRGFRTPSLTFFPLLGV